MKKILAFALALAMLLSFGSFAMAEELDYNPDAWYYVSSTDDPTHMDPYLCSDGQSTIVTGLIYDALVVYNLDGSLAPNVAESWDVSDDALTYTFHIRPGIKFHDGTDLDAYAVEWNWDRVVPAEGKTFADEPYVNMPYAELFYSDVASYEATDASTFVVTLKEPNNAFLTLIGSCSLAAGIISPTAYEADPEGFDKHPVGSGPYKFVEWVSGQYVQLERNDDYHLGKPTNAGVIIRIIPEANTAVNELITGGIYSLNYMTEDDYATIENSGTAQMMSYQGNTLSIMSFADYEKNPLFSDIRLRQAIGYALDFDTIVSALYGDSMETATSAIPYLMAGGDYDGYTSIGYDPDKAKELMAEAGYPDGFEFTLMTYNVVKGYNPAAEKLAVTIQSELAKVGITCHIMIVSPWSEFLNVIYTDPIPEGDQHYDVVLHGWGADYNDTSNILFLFSDDQIGDGANHSGYTDPEFNEYFDNAVRSTSYEEATEWYIKAAQKLNDDVPVYIIAHGVDHVATSNVIINPEECFGGIGNHTWKIKLNADN